MNARVGRYRSIRLINLYAILNNKTHLCDNRDRDERERDFKTTAISRLTTSVIFTSIDVTILQVHVPPFFTILVCGISYMCFSPTHTHTTKEKHKQIN